VPGTIIPFKSSNNPEIDLNGLNVLNPESAVEEPSKHERGVILEQRRHGTEQVHRIFSLYHPVIVDLEIRTRVLTNEGPLRGCSLLDSLRKGRFPFFMPKSTTESGLNRQKRVQKSYEPS
jgi:hypothetical protein